MEACDYRLVVHKSRCFPYPPKPAPLFFTYSLIIRCGMGEALDAATSKQINLCWLREMRNASGTMGGHATGLCGLEVR
jgi:hypothetical protein